jgi:hypothetical protein
MQRDHRDSLAGCRAAVAPERDFITAAIVEGTRRPTQLYGPGRLRTCGRHGTVVVSKRERNSTMTHPKPDDTARRTPPKPKSEPAERGGDVRHIIDKGLPPGIGVQDAIDPGAQTPRTPVDDRS